MAVSFSMMFSLLLAYTFFESFRGRPLNGEFAPLVGDMELCSARQTKVRYLGLTVAVQQDVPGCQVPEEQSHTLDYYYCYY